MSEFAHAYDLGRRIERHGLMGLTPLELFAFLHVLDTGAFACRLEPLDRWVKGWQPCWTCVLLSEDLLR